MWFDREIAEGLSRAAAQFPVIVLTGPRQVGKTALLRRQFAALGYLSLDLPSQAEMAETRPDALFAAHPPPLLIDEVQYAPQLFRHLKHHVDAHPETKAVFVLTGSQSFELMHGVADSLAGRAAIFALLGLSGAEWSKGNANADGSAWLEFLWRGSYPGLWASQDNPEASPDRDRWYASYVATYLERDVRAAVRASSLRDFDRFIRACAARTGQLLNLTSLGRDVGISATTARDWLSVLQASNQVFLLEPYHRSLGKRLVKSPKLYFTDTGLASFLLGFASPQTLWSSPAAGAVWETYVVGQWLRWQQWIAPAASLWFWQDKGGHEVDLLIEYQGRLLPIECKLSENPSRKDLAGIQKLRQFYGEAAIGPATVASPSMSTYELDGTTVRAGWTSWSL